MNIEVGGSFRIQLMTSLFAAMANLEATLNDFWGEGGDPGERGLGRLQPLLIPARAPVVPGLLQKVLGPPLPARRRRLLGLGDVALQLLGLLQRPLVPCDNAGLDPDMESFELHHHTIVQLAFGTTRFGYGIQQGNKIWDQRTFIGLISKLEICPPHPLDVCL